MLKFYPEYLRYKQLVEAHLRRLLVQARGSPESIRVPMRYVLSSRGKRIRPILVILACKAVGGQARDALDAAVAIEALHNFTLVHDDIMDHATVRRGRPSVHEKWDENTAILLGDELVALAYRSLLKTKAKRFPEIVSVFTEGVVEVCEGQGLDKEFDTRTDVTLDEYMVMILKKTGRMVAVAAQIGGLIANGSDRELNALKGYGEHVGTAFQIQDDLLDIAAGQRKFGKAIGGDLTEGKRTYLLIRGLEVAKGKDKALLKKAITNSGIPRSKISQVRQIYEAYGVLENARAEILSHTLQAERKLAKVRDGQAKQMLYWFADVLLNRSF